MTLLLATSIFFTTPAPLDLPRAEAFLVKQGETRRLEDRFNRYDLWMSRAVIGRWYDDERTFVLSRLDILPPAILDGASCTRCEYDEGTVKADPKDTKHLHRMIDCLSPIAPAEEFSPPRQMPIGYKDVRYCQGTNESTIVCAFRPERSGCWYLATWELSASDTFDDCLEEFERDFLEKKAWQEILNLVDERMRQPGAQKHRNREKPNEFRKLKDDLIRGVAAYDVWYAGVSADAVVLDDLPTRSLEAALTNSVPKWRERYASILPTPLDGTNAVAAVRVYYDRDDYLEAAGENMKWSAAYWCQARREIVACIPQQGETALLKTLRHEAFHQYLSYATAMIPASPWLNEGYAEYFEADESAAWGAVLTPNDVDRYATMLPALIRLDYEQFYSGTDEARRIKYKLAWSIAAFLEHGAPKVRFEPFKNVKRNYVEALLETQDMLSATAAAFGSEDGLAHFITEWKRFWKNQ